MTEEEENRDKIAAVMCALVPFVHLSRDSEWEQKAFQLPAKRRGNIGKGVPTHRRARWLVGTLCDERVDIEMTTQDLEEVSCKKCLLVLDEG